MKTTEEILDRYEKNTDTDFSELICTYRVEILELMKISSTDSAYYILKQWSYCSCNDCLGRVMSMYSLNPSRPPDDFLLQRDKIDCPMLKRAEKAENELKELKKKYEKGNL